MTENFFKSLRKMPVLAGLSDQTLTLLIEHANLVEKDPGEFYFRQDDPSDSVFVLQDGVVAIERLWQQEPVELGRLSRGDCFGEMSLIDLMPRSASVKALSECFAIELPHNCLHNLYKQDLEQYAIIMMNMGREVSRRLRVTDNRLFELEQQLPEFAP